MGLTFVSCSPSSLSNFLFHFYFLLKAFSYDDVYRKQNGVAGRCSRGCEKKHEVEKTAQKKIADTLVGNQNCQSLIYVDDLAINEKRSSLRKREIHSFRISSFHPSPLAIHSLRVFHWQKTFSLSASVCGAEKEKLPPKRVAEEVSVGG